MLSLFPQILFLAPFSAMLLRITLAVLLAYMAWSHFSTPRTIARSWGVLEVIAAVLLLVGAWTQIVVIVVFVGIFLGFFIPWMRIFPKSTMLLALVMCVCLLVTGAGAIAFDLPL